MPLRTVWPSAIVMHSKYADGMGLMSNPIADHHRGLYDMDEFRNLLKNGAVA